MSVNMIQKKNIRKLKKEKKRKEKFRCKENKKEKRWTLYLFKLSINKDIKIIGRNAKLIF